MMYQYAPGQDTATSCVWLQLWMPTPLWGQSVSLVSVPAQVMLLRRMGLAVVSFTENDWGAVENRGWGGGGAKDIHTVCLYLVNTCYIWSIILAWGMWLNEIMGFVRPS